MLYPLAVNVVRIVNGRSKMDSPGDKARLENIRDLTEVIQPTSVVPEVPSNIAPLDSIVSLREQLIYINERILPWWSRQRDYFLWQTLVRSDVLSSATNITSARLFSVPFQIVPRDKANRRDSEIAFWSTALLQHSWSTEMFRFIIDWQTQDNGAFLEILGGGDPAGPIEPTLVPGTATWLYGLGLRHLDSQMATRTGNPTYPVRYRAKDGRGKMRDYKLHSSRVIFNAQMESPRWDMYGVGFCATSRAISHILHMGDISTLKEEWLGSRPVSEIVLGKGFTGEQISAAFRSADEKANAEGLQRFAKVVFLGIEGNADLVRAAGLERIQLKRLPEGYDEEKAMTIAINIIAMAFGFDARTLWPATVRGATRADAEVQHLKTMKMTPGIWEETMKRLLMEKYCPGSCEVLADQKDDEQDAIVSENKQLRAQIRQLMLDSNQINLKVCYEMMKNDGDLSDSQYEYLLSRLDEDGNLPVVAAPTQPNAQPATPPDSGNTPADPSVPDAGQAALEEMFKNGSFELASGNGREWQTGNGRH